MINFVQEVKELHIIAKNEYKLHHAIEQIEESL